MENSAAWIYELIVRNAVWAPLIIGILCFGESLVIVGLFIPAMSLMIATGSLLASGRLDAGAIVGAAIIGSVLGDWVSYIVGQRLGPAAYRHWPLREHRTSIAHARLFFRRYGFWAVFIGRFLGPLRAVVPLIAGVTRMPQRSFQVANVASAALWVPALFAPGYLSAKHLVTPERANDGSLLVIGFVVGGLVALGGWMLSKFAAADRRRKKAFRRSGSPPVTA